MPGNRPHYGRWPQHDFPPFKKLRPQSVTSRIQPGSDVIVCAEMDEQWGYVGAKSRQRWLFYAYDRLRKTVVAHVFGERTMATLGRLMSLLSPFDVVIWMTDGWPLYESRLKGKLHVISKRYTQRIERHNLNLRQHLARLGRKSLSFSKSVELHDKVIGHYLGTVAKLAMRQPFVLFKGLTFQKLCLPGAFRPGDHHNKMLRPGLCVVHASPQYL